MLIHYRTAIGGSKDKEEVEKGMGDYFIFNGQK